jgi:antitoxin ParD1/3/4
MNISLTPELEKFVNDKVKSGRYHSASEVIREGLRLLEEQEQLREVKLAALREEIQKGLASGKPIPGTEVFDELRTKAKQRKKVHA